MPCAPFLIVTPKPSTPSPLLPAAGPTFFFPESENSRVPNQSPELLPFARLRRFRSCYRLTPFDGQGGVLRQGRGTFQGAMQHGHHQLLRSFGLGRNSETQQGGLFSGGGLNGGFQGLFFSWGGGLVGMPGVLENGWG